VSTLPGGPPPVAATLVNWNGWRDTLECLDSLAQLRYPDLAVYLCDNASSDDSIVRIIAWADARQWPTVAVTEREAAAEPSLSSLRGSPYLVIVRHHTNAGFAGGTNVAMRCALASGRAYRYLWALNTDTIVHPDALGELVRALEVRPDAASSQSLLLQSADPTRLDSAGIRLLVRGGSKDILRGRPVAMLDLEKRNGRPLEVFGCCAASALYRAAALEQVRLFDETFFQTNEDVDLACRLRAAGYQAWLVPTSVVRHKGGVSRRRKYGRMWFISHRNKLRVIARWWPRWLSPPALLIGVVRGWWAMVRAPDVPTREWAESLAVLWREYWGGAPERTRSRTFWLGWRGLLG